MAKKKLKKCFVARNGRLILVALACQIINSILNNTEKSYREMTNVFKIVEHLYVHSIIIIYSTVQCINNLITVQF